MKVDRRPRWRPDVPGYKVSKEVAFEVKNSRKYQRCSRKYQRSPTKYQRVLESIKDVRENIKIR